VGSHGGVFGGNEVGRTKDELSMGEESRQGSGYSPSGWSRGNLVTKFVLPPDACGRVDPIGVQLGLSRRPGAARIR
jgi:hypothetical protein